MSNNPPPSLFSISRANSVTATRKRMEIKRMLFLFRRNWSIVDPDLHL
jgi:hypothetical protein